MSKTDMENKDLPLGNASSSSGQTVGNDLFNFDAVDTSTQKPSSQPQAEPPKPQPAQPAQPAQPVQSGGAIDFESLAGMDGGNPFM